MLQRFSQKYDNIFEAVGYGGQVMLIVLFLVQRICGGKATSCQCLLQLWSTGQPSSSLQLCYTMMITHVINVCLFVATKTVCGTTFSESVLKLDMHMQLYSAGVMYTVLVARQTMNVVFLCLAVAKHFITSSMLPQHNLNAKYSQCIVYQCKVTLMRSVDNAEGAQLRLTSIHSSLYLNPCWFAQRCDTGSSMVKRWSRWKRLSVRLRMSTQAPS